LTDKILMCLFFSKSPKKKSHTAIALVLGNSESVSFPQQQYDLELPNTKAK